MFTLNLIGVMFVVLQLKIFHVSTGTAERYPKDPSRGSHRLSAKISVVLTEPTIAERVQRVLRQFWSCEISCESIDRSQSHHQSPNCHSFSIPTTISPIINLMKASTNFNFQCKCFHLLLLLIGRGSSFGFWSGRQNPTFANRNFACNTPRLMLAPFYYSRKNSIARGRRFFFYPINQLTGLRTNFLLHSSTAPFLLMDNHQKSTNLVARRSVALFSSRRAEPDCSHTTDIDSINDSSHNRSDCQYSILRDGTFGRRTMDTIEIAQQQPLVDHSNDHDELWQIYTLIITDVMNRQRVIGKLKGSALVQAQEYLLTKPTNGRCTSSASMTWLSDGITPFPINDASANRNSSKDDKLAFRVHLHKQRSRFLQEWNMSDPSYDYCGRCLVYLADKCAQTKQPLACLYAWKKLREIGLAPKENALSTFLYVLSSSTPEIINHQPLLSNTTDVSSEPRGANVPVGRSEFRLRQLQQEVSFDVADFHDLLYEASENTVALRVKALVSKGDANAAEEILASLSDKKFLGNETEEKGNGSSTIAASLSLKRLRTYAPILEHYFEIGDMMSALRLYREMQQSDGVHLNAETFAKILSELARHRWFNSISSDSCWSSNETLMKLKSYGFLAMSGPALLDEIATEMANDILEIDENSADILIKSFNVGNDTEQGTSTTSREGFARRVTIDSETAMCPESKAQLQLFTLSSDQIKHLRITLLEMAASQHEEFGDKLIARRQGQSSKTSNSTTPLRTGQYALSELTKFSDWLRFRRGDAFTAIVDGPNVAYYGHGDVRWSQVSLVVDKLEELGEVPLVIMPQKYLASKFWLSSVGYMQELSETELAIMNHLLGTNKMYIVPTACLDDYYWMLGSVAKQNTSIPVRDMHNNKKDGTIQLKGVRPVLVTNDQMRDHRLSLLAPRLFRRWTSCHIVNYDIKTAENDEQVVREVNLFPADSFSREIQKNKAIRFGKEVAAWHFPVVEWPEQDRLCVVLHGYQMPQQ